MSSRFRAQRTALGCALVALSVVCPAAVLSAQASTYNSLTNGISGCFPSTSGAASGTSTSQVWISTFTGSDCDLRASSFSYLGVVGAHSTANWNTPNWNGGSVVTYAQASWLEAVQPGMNAIYLTQLDVKKLTIKFSVGATGSVSASSGGGIGYSTAHNGYLFDFGGGTGNGGESRSSTGDYSRTGEWGTISRTVDIFAQPDFVGGWFLNPFQFSMSGSAYTALVKPYFPNQYAVNSADANFGSTLVWGGVQEVRAFDSNGNEVILGTDAGVSFTGALSGNNYMNAAAVTVTATPEPATMLLLATGIAGIAVFRRRARTT